jgi:hypothetical protein
VSRTIVVSDLHLGAASGRDVLRGARLRAPLLELITGADRVVLLGDVVELLEGPPADALATARPLLRAIGQAGLDEVVLVPGNHDRGLIRAWIERRHEQGMPLALDEPVPPDASPGLAGLLEALAPAPVRVAYPGVWLRDDVYATHGHYLDAHLEPPPRLEGVLPWWRDWIAPLPHGPVGPDAYEAVLAGPYADIEAHIRARSAEAAGRGRRLGAAVAGAVAEAVLPVVTRMTGGEGLAPLSAGLLGFEVRRAGLDAFEEVLERLGLEPEHVIFGHIHRAGPLEGEAVGPWATRRGTRLTNTGAWTYSPLLLAGASSANPYWPGSCVVLDDGGPPRVERLLTGLASRDLRSA